MHLSLSLSLSLSPYTFKLLPSSQERQGVPFSPNKTYNIHNSKFQNQQVQNLIIQKSKVQHFQKHYFYLDISTYKLDLHLYIYIYIYTYIHTSTCPSSQKLPGEGPADGGAICAYDVCVCVCVCAYVLRIVNTEVTFTVFPGLSTSGKAECINRAVPAPSSTHSQRLHKSLGIAKSMYVCMYV